MWNKSGQDLYIYEHQVQQCLKSLFQLSYLSHRPTTQKGNDGFFLAVKNLQLVTNLKIPAGVRSAKKLKKKMPPKTTAKRNTG